MFSSQNEDLFVSGKSALSRKREKDLTIHRNARTRKFILSFGGKATEVAKEIGAWPGVYWGDHGTTWQWSDEYRNFETEISCRDMDSLPSTFKRKDNNVRGWVRLECGCHWGRHPNGARRGNRKRKKEFYKPPVISVESDFSLLS
jgi:hypothetical protein